MHTAHAHSTCTQHMHTAHAHSTCTQHMPTAHAHSTCTASKGGARMEGQRKCTRGRQQEVAKMEGSRQSSKDGRTARHPGAQQDIQPPDNAHNTNANHYLNHKQRAKKVECLKRMTSKTRYSKGLKHEVEYRPQRQGRVEASNKSCCQEIP